MWRISGVNKELHPIFWEGKGNGNCEMQKF
jgi:hypothetical protein